MASRCSFEGSPRSPAPAPSASTPTPIASGEIVGTAGDDVILGGGGDDKIIARSSPGGGNIVDAGLGGGTPHFEHVPGAQTL